MKRETRIGLMVVSGFLAAYLFISWAKSIHLFSVSRKTYQISFENVNGLKEGDPVSVRGYWVGNVVSIRLPQNNLDASVLVEISLDPTVSVFSDATAEIQMKELLGGKMVALNTGSSGGKRDKTDPIQGYSGADFSTAFSSFGGLAKTMNPEKLDSILLNFTQVAKVFADVSKNIEADKVDRFFTASLGTMEQLNHNLAYLGRSNLFVRMDSALTQFNRLANSSEKMISRADQTISGMKDSYLGKIDSTFSQLGATLSETRKALAEVQGMLSSAKNVNMLSGKLMNDPAFATEMETALKNLNRTLELVNSNRLKVGLAGRKEKEKNGE